MPYNLDLEYRIDKLADRFGISDKKKMFGGICYLLNGNMCFGIYKEFLIVRTTVEKADELMKNESVTPFDITGRPMKGWVMISPDYVETDTRLESMLQLGRDFVKKLP
jgi:hypothetical protein